MDPVSVQFKFRDYMRAKRKEEKCATFWVINVL